MHIHLFSADANNLLYSRRNENGVIVGPRTIDTNIHILSDIQLQSRFFADIIKDSQAGTRVGNIIQHLMQCYPVQGNAGIIPNGITQYKNALLGLEHAIFTDAEIINKVTNLTNILKTSTVGSNTKISYAENVFWESGFGTDSICAANNIIRVGTPAAKMDPLPKEKYTMYFPQPGTAIEFNPSFTQRLGFINTVWQIDGASNVRIRYGQLPGYTITADVGENITKPMLSETEFGGYILGNNEKNQIIADLPVNNDNCNEFIKLVETKELGDVAQVWLYLAYIIHNNLVNDRIRAVMITTDSVVYLFCVLLNLSCVYTGSREGVLSGHCTLKHYLAGQPNFSNKIQTMIKVHYDRIEAHNNAIKFGLRIMTNDFNNFEYYRSGRGNDLVKTYGNTKMIPRIKERVVALFNEIIQEIEAQTVRANNAFIQFRDRAAINDADVSDIFNNFCQLVNVEKCEQYITKLSSKKYILQPSTLLNRFAAIVADVDIQIPNTIQGIIARSEYVTADIGIQQGGIRQKRYLKGGDIKSRDKLNTEIYYYEFLLLWYVSHIIITRNGGTNIEHYTRIKRFLANENKRSIFALVYDNTIYSINYDTILINDNLDNRFRDILYSTTDDEIIEYGRELSKYIYFADDKDIEEAALSVELKTSEIQRNMLPAFQQYQIEHPVRIVPPIASANTRAQAPHPVRESVKPQGIYGNNARRSRIGTMLNRRALRRETNKASRQSTRNAAQGANVNMGGRGMPRRHKPKHHRRTHKKHHKRRTHKKSSR